MVRMGVRSARLRWAAPKVQAARPGAAQVYSRSREKWKRATRSEQVLSCKLDAAQRSEVPVDHRAPLADQLYAEVDSGHRAEDRIDVRRAGRFVEAVRSEERRVGKG